MNPFLPEPHGRGPLEPETTERLDPFLQKLVEKRPWELHSGRWRAWTLAEMAFGSGVSVSLAGRLGYAGFRGLLHLSIPFRTLEDHSRRESLFLSWAGEDPILSRLPLVFVFEPNPVEVP